MGFDLEQTAKELKTLGFDTSIGERALSALLDEGSVVTEITIDSSGYCLLKKKFLNSSNSFTTHLLEQDTPITKEEQTLYQIHFQLRNTADLIFAINNLGKLLK